MISATKQNLVIATLLACSGKVACLMDLPELIGGEKWPPQANEDGTPIIFDPAKLKLAQEKGNALMYFHAPWCGHCVHLQPEYEKASKMIYDDVVVNATIATFDGNMYQDATKEQDLTGYPTIRWFTPHGDHFDYQGPRKANQIATWVRFMTIDPVSDMVQLPVPRSSDNERVHVTLVAPARTPAFERVALQYRTQARWGFVEDLDGQIDQKIVVHKPNEDPTEMYDIHDVEKVRAFFLRDRLETFGELTKDSFTKFKAQGEISLVYVLFDHADDVSLATQVEEFRSAVKKLAKKWWDQFSFVWVNTKANGASLRDSFGINAIPAVTVTNPHEPLSEKFVLSGAPDSAKIQEFLTGIVGGTMRPIFKSEDVPEVSSNAVQKVVGKTILSEVFRPDRDFFLEVYAPWCAHCRTTGPQVEIVGQTLADLSANDLVQVGRINGQLNDSPGKLVSWEHFPTLIYVKAGSDEKIVYEGERTARAMLSFIAEQTDQQQLSSVLCKNLSDRCTDLSCSSVPARCDVNKEAAEKSKPAVSQPEDHMFYNVEL